MGLLRARLGALYGGRRGRTTAVLATTSAAAGALTGLMGVGLAASHDTPAPVAHVKAAKARHHASTTPTAYSHIRPTHSRSPSPTPTATKTTATPTPSAAPTASSTPSAPASSPPPSDPASAPASASPPG